MSNQSYKDKKVMLIGVVKEMTGLTERKVRYFEKKKLIAPEHGNIHFWMSRCYWQWQKKNNSQNKLTGKIIIYDLAAGFLLKAPYCQVM